MNVYLTPKQTREIFDFGYFKPVEMKKNKKKSGGAEILSKNVGQFG